MKQKIETRDIDTELNMDDKSNADMIRLLVEMHTNTEAIYKQIVGILFNNSGVALNTTCRINCKLILTEQVQEAQNRFVRFLANATQQWGYYHVAFSINNVIIEYVDNGLVSVKPAQSSGAVFAVDVLELQNANISEFLIPVCHIVSLTVF